MTPIAKARAALGLYLAEKKKSRSKLYADEEAEAIERVGLAIEMSGRNLRRYFAVLSASIEVQLAFERGLVKLVDAARVITLSKADQEQLAARLRGGEDAKEVFAEFFPPRDGRHLKPIDAVAAFARSLRVAGDDVGGRLEQVRPAHVRRFEQQLRSGVELLSNLLRKLDVVG